MNLKHLLEANRTPTVLGIDDAPGGEQVHFAGVICQGIRMEGLIWGTVTRDGDDATEAILRAVQGKFQRQLHAVLTDGITLAGLNLIDLERLHAELGVPCVAVLRRPPDLVAFRAAMEAAGVSDRWAMAERAGPVHEVDKRVFQVVGAEPSTIARLLARVTDRGKVPEALRLAHLIGGAVTSGTSGKRA